MKSSFLLGTFVSASLLAIVPSNGGIPPANATALDPVNCANAALYSSQHGGEALRIEQGGRLVFENYLPGFSADTPHKIYSGTKSFVALSAVVLAQHGKLKLDERASDTLTEWKNDTRRSITIDQLLSQTSGLDPNGERIYASPDQLAAAVGMPLVSAPGTRFHYGAAGYQAFGELLRRKLGSRAKTVEDIVTDTAINPCHVDVDSWKRDDAGNVLIHAGMAMTAHEWAKFGAALVPLYYRAGYESLFRGHAANPAYGLGFWLNAPQPARAHQSIRDLQPAIDGDQLYPGGPADLFAALGTGHQRLYVVPSRQLVVVRFSHQAAFSDGDFLSRLLTGRPLPDKHTH